MKKLILLSSCYFIATAVIAQPTIQSSDFYPTIGESFSLNYGSYISPGSAGNNVTWDLSGMTSSSVVTVTALAANPSFAGTDMTLTYSGQSSLYVDFTTTEYNINGMFQIPTSATITYSDPMKYYEFPMSIGEAYTDNFEATFTSGGFLFTRTGTISNEVDGYGTLITPQGTYTNVLRVHSVQEYTDVFDMGSMDVVIDNYTWIKAGIHNEIAMVQTMTSDVGSGSSAYYISNTLGIDKNELSSLKVYPNPSNDQITVSNSDRIDFVEISDLNGKIVYTANTGSLVEVIDISRLENGIYYLTIHSNNAVGVQKIIKK